MIQKIFQNTLVLFLILFSFNVMAETANSVENNDNVKSNFTLNEKGQIILDTIQELEDSGYITKKNAREAKAELVFSKADLLSQEKPVKDQVKNTDIEWGEYLSWINLLKILGIISILIAFRGFVFKFLIHLVKIPTIIYQTLFLTMTLAMSFFPEHIYAEQATYIAIFGVIANIIVLAWIVGTYEDFFMRIFKIFSLNLSPFIVGCFYTSLYFGLFAIQLDSQLLGVLSCIAFVGMFGFIFETSGIHTIIGYREDDYMAISLIINGLIVLGFSLISINEIDVPYLSVFTSGIQYVCTIVFAVTLLIYSSFIFKNEKGFALSILLMIAAEAFSLISMTLYNLEVIPAIINTAFFLFVVGWVGYITKQISGILMAFVLGVLLYGSAVYIEKNPELFITALF